jgi:hypothetical protein
MRRQNPPQASLDQALALEKYLSPFALGVTYALCAIVGFAVVALFFAVLVYDYILNAAVVTTVLFSLVALVPAVFAIFAFMRRPDDPLSRAIRNLADSRRQPISVKADRYSFTVLLMTGEPLCVNLAFHYPAKYHLPEVRERLNAFVRSALERECCNRSDLPKDQEINAVVDRALDVVAAEFEVPVLYSELRDMHKIRDAYSNREDLTPSEYLGLGTGTLG